jgi:chemotaxis protein MotB
MSKTNKTKFFASETKILFWPSFVDMLITTLMTILLVYFLQTVFNVGDLETLRIRQEQDEFAAGFEKKFSLEKKQGKIAVHSGLNLIRITFSDEILFHSGDYQLQPQGKEILRRVAELFKNSNAYSFKQIQVEGHTDNEPVSNIYKYPHNNWELSTGRAISVIKFLIDDNHLSERFSNRVIVSANGYAEFRPVENNNNEQGKAKNRRIEILIIFSTPENNKK